MRRGQVPDQEKEEPQAGEQAGEGGATGDGDSGRPEDTDKFDAAYVKSLRQEAAKYRAKVKELEDQQKAQEDAKLSEAEKLRKQQAEAQQRATEAEQRLRAAAARYEVMLTATRLGCVDPEAAYRLIDQESLEFGKDGSPINAERVLKDLLKARPYLAGKAQEPPKQGNAANPASGAHAGQLTRDDIRKMAPEEINRRWEEVSAAMAEGR